METKKAKAICFDLSVRMEGLEPPRLAAPDPKSGAATNYATSGKGGRKYIGYLEIE